MKISEFIDAVHKVYREHNLNIHKSDLFEEALFLYFGGDDQVKPSTSFILPWDSDLQKVIPSLESEKIDHIAVSIGVDQSSFDTFLSNLERDFPKLFPVQIESQIKPGRDELGPLLTMQINISDESFSRLLDVFKITAENIMATDEQRARFKKQEEQQTRILDEQQSDLFLRLVGKQKLRFTSPHFRSFSDEWYDDKKIGLIMAGSLDANFPLVSGCSFRRQASSVTIEQCHVYIPVYTPAVAHDSGQITYYLDKTTQPQPINVDEIVLLKDVFDELEESLTQNENCLIRIITPCSWSNVHWTTLQFDIKRQETTLTVSMFNHDPKHASGKFPDELRVCLEEALKRRLLGIFPEGQLIFEPYSKEHYPYRARQDEFDGNNCGPIHCADALHLMHLEPLKSGYYSQEDCKALRKAHKLYLQVDTDKHEKTTTRGAVCTLPTTGVLSTMFTSCLQGDEFRTQLVTFAETLKQKDSENAAESDGKDVLSVETVLSEVRGLIFAPNELYYIHERLLVLCETGILSILQKYPQLQQQLLSYVPTSNVGKQSKNNVNLLDRLLVTYLLLGNQSFQNYDYKESTDDLYKAHYTLYKCFEPEKHEYNLQATMSLVTNLIKTCLESGYVNALAQLLEFKVPKSPQAQVHKNLNISPGSGSSISRGQGFQISKVEFMSLTDNDQAAEELIDLNKLRIEQLPLLHFYAYNGKVEVVKRLMACSGIKLDYECDIEGQQLTAIDYARTAQNNDGITKGAQQCIKVIAEKLGKPVESVLPTVVEASMFATPAGGATRDVPVSFKIVFNNLKKKKSKIIFKTLQKVEPSQLEQLCSWLKDQEGGDECNEFLGKVIESLDALNPYRQAWDNLSISMDCAI